MNKLASWLLAACALGGTGSAAAFVDFRDAIHWARAMSQAGEGGHQSKDSGTKGAVPALPPATGDFRDCLDQFANKEPPIVKNAPGLKARALCFDGFAVLHSGQRKTPVFAAAVLSKERILAARKLKRTDLFFADARLPASERATLDDYRGSGLDRGHNVPAADLATPEGVAQSFSLANIVPQARKNNQGPWSEIEQSTRKYVLRAKGDVFVITGSLLLPGACTLASVSCQIGNGVTVPSHLYKLVYDASSHRAWAHWIENSDSARISKPISYAELVRRTGIEFLPGVSTAHLKP